MYYSINVILCKQDVSIDIPSATTETLHPSLLNKRVLYDSLHSGVFGNTGLS